MIRPHLSFGLLLAASSPLVAQTAPSTAIAAAQPAKGKAVADPNKVRCKTSVETGSLAKTNKVCHTNAEWRSLAEQGRDDANRYRDVMASSRGGS